MASLEKNELLQSKFHKKLLIGKNRALRWSISGMGKQKYTVAEPNFERQEN